MDDIAILKRQIADLEYRLNTHRHQGSDLTAKIPQKVYVPIRIVANGTNTTVTAVQGGDYVVPFSGYIVNVEATVDTAGVTGTTDIDVNLNGTSIMATKITIDTTEKTSRTAATRPVINTFGFTAGDIFTFDVDAIQTTAAKGLTIHLDLISNS